MTLYIASDHAGYELKSSLLSEFPKFNWKDLGPGDGGRVDYPDFADRMALAMKAEPDSMGVLICGSGQGVAMRANRYLHVRAAICWTEEIATLSRAHNDANVLCLGARIVDKELAAKILVAFLSGKFEGGRHEERIKKLSLPVC